jgi:hypothetical protein
MLNENSRLAAGVLALVVAAVIAYGATAQDGAADQRVAIALEKLVRVQVVGHQLAYEQQNFLRLTNELEAARVAASAPAKPRPGEDYFAKVEAEHLRMAAEQRAMYDKQEADMRHAQSRIASLQRDLAAIRTRIDAHLQTLQSIEKGQ